MTELQFRDETTELLKGIIKMFHDDVDMFIKTEKNNMESYDLDPILSQMFVCAFGKNIHDQYIPWRNPSANEHRLIRDIYMEI